MKTKRFVVNSEGETIRDFPDGSCECTEASSVDRNVLARSLGRSPTNDDIDREFDRLSRLHHKPWEHACYEEWKRIQGVWTKYDGLYRCYCEAFPNGVKHAWFSTEFQWFTDDNGEFAKEVAAFAKAVGGSVDVMQERPHLDHFKPAGGKWQYGPDHGAATPGQRGR